MYNAIGNFTYSHCVVLLVFYLLNTVDIVLFSTIQFYCFWQSFFILKKPL